MIDYELIKKVCNLTCSKEDVDRDQTTVKYDTEYPFKKNYSIETIIGAFNKYINHEWDDKTLACWACIYCWILEGGANDALKENINSLEEFLKNVITWDLDGLSFFGDSLLEDKSIDLAKWMQQYKNLDHVWNTRENWKGTYATITFYAEDNGEQYVVLINDVSKEYIIIFSDHLENKYEDENFKFVSDEEFIDLIEKLKENNYKILSYSEKSYYSDISDE